MNERIEKFKKHIQENKNAYIAGGICLGVGILGGLVIANKTDIKQTIDSYKFQYKSPTNNNITTILVRQGHPGNIVRCDQTGVVFPSQGNAAKSMGLDPGALSKHLKGKSPHVKGKTFTNLGEAA